MTNNLSGFSLESAISNAIKIPGVKVNRSKFLAETFSSRPNEIENIISVGTIEAGLTKEELAKIADRLILKRTSESSIASFAAGLPGGLVMAATIPADVLQFFGMTLRLAQELSYLYGAQDLWQDGQIDDERVKNQLILYCGVMFGVTGASAGVRVLSNQLAKTTLKRLPQKALTKTFWYPILKQIGKAVGYKVTKSTVAKGVSKAIPVVGGVISGSINFTSMMPMAKKLHKTLEKACFNYTEEEFEKDFIEIENFNSDDLEEPPADKKKFTSTLKITKSKISDKIGTLTEPKATSPDDLFLKIEKLSKLKEIGALTEEEYSEKKAELLSRI